MEVANASFQTTNIIQSQHVVICHIYKWLHLHRQLPMAVKERDWQGEIDIHGLNVTLAVPVFDVAQHPYTQSHTEVSSSICCNAVW